MAQDGTEGGEFTEVVLRPRVRLRAGDVETANGIHHDVHRYCFIARSIAVPIRHEPTADLAP